MKKISLLVLGCAMLIGFSAMAQEITYVEDPAQGYTFNRFKDNWFIQAEGGAGVLFSPADKQVDKLKDRIGLKADLAFGKWFTPIIAVRVGGEFSQYKGATDTRYEIVAGSRPEMNDRLKPGAPDYITYQLFNEVGFFADAMINLTNWWCGYKPGRIYNAVFYGGVGVNWTMYRQGAGDGSWKYAGGEEPKFRAFTPRVGLMNTFTVSKRVDIMLDLRATMFNKYIDGYGKRSFNLEPAVLLGITYNIGKRDWDAPIVAVCPTWKYTDAEGDALVARLAAADAKIASLEKQLYDCLHRVTPTPDPKPAPVVSADAPLATIYYPIGKSAITPEQKKVVEAVANVMNDNDKNYVLTGWADNYTGTDKINAKLRKDRVNGVKDALTKLGVGADRLDAQINDGNLTSFGPKCAAIDRAVTVNVAK
ncbi:MAG: OmpA family protein [Muribaculaceae bacterium]|nr:OmpA family protein [Muribaculaceae bacterium]